MGLREDIENLGKEVKEVRNIKEESIALSFLNDYKKQNKRLFIIWLITFLILACMTAYTIYIINDIGTITETNVTQENETGHNSYIEKGGLISYAQTND